MDAHAADSIFASSAGSADESVTNSSISPSPAIFASVSLPTFDPSATTTTRSAWATIAWFVRAVEAARTGDPRLVRQAVLMDPNANSTLTPDRIWELCNDLVAAHGELLPEPLRVQIPADSL